MHDGRRQRRLDPATFSRTSRFRRLDAELLLLQLPVPPSRARFRAAVGGGKVARCRRAWGWLTALYCYDIP